MKTKTRVINRRKYDDLIREKERVIATLKLSLRMEEMEREKLELKELRRRLDEKVKAHPVPDWLHTEAHDDEDSQDDDIQSGEEF